MNASKPRKSPCASCPYRCEAPSGVWDQQEYDKLVDYDGDISDQSTAAIFMCHQGAGDVCSGWLGHRTEPTDLLAVRIGLMDGHLDPACADYETTVPLFATGAQAAAHGTRDIDNPSNAARQTIRKITAVRDLAGNPVQHRHGAPIEATG